MRLDSSSVQKNFYNFRCFCLKVGDLNVAKMPALSSVLRYKFTIKKKLNWKIIIRGFYKQLMHLVTIIF